MRSGELLWIVCKMTVSVLDAKLVKISLGNAIPRKFNLCVMDGQTDGPTDKHTLIEMRERIEKNEREKPR